jgi:hypothetical protein
VRAHGPLAPRGRRRRQQRRRRSRPVKRHVAAEELTGVEVPIPPAWSTGQTGGPGVAADGKKRGSVSAFFLCTEMRGPFQKCRLARRTYSTREPQTRDSTAATSSLGSLSVN